MVQEKKVILMTKCAIYENEHGKQELPAMGYFKRDYVKFNTLKSLISVLVAYLLIIGAYVGIYYEKVFEELNLLHFKDLGIKAGILLLIIMFVYYVIAHIVYIRRYDAVKKNVAKYYRNLKQLQALYREERHARVNIDKGGESTQNDEFIDY